MSDDNDKTAAALLEAREKFKQAFSLLIESSLTVRKNVRYCINQDIVGMTPNIVSYIDDKSY